MWHEAKVGLWHIWQEWGLGAFGQGCELCETDLIRMLSLHAELRLERRLLRLPLVALSVGSLEHLLLDRRRGRGLRGELLLRRLEGPRALREGG